MTSRQEILIDTTDARVRIMFLGPGEVVPWHSHSQVTDDIFCLSGTVEVEMKNPERILVLEPGHRCRVSPPRRHQVLNRGRCEASYLLVQGGGRYDFLKNEG